MAQSPDVLLQQMAKSLEEIAKNSSEERKLRLLPQGDRAGATAAQRSSGSLFSAGGAVQASQKVPGMGAVGSVMGAAGGAMTAFAGAAGMAVSSISQLTGMVSQFVSAVNPSIMQALGRAMHDLNAAIGQAFTGAMEEAIGYVRELGSIINPLAQELQPIITQFAEVMRELAVAQVQAFAETLRALAPVLKLFADGLQAVVPLISSWLTVLQAGIKSFAEWIGDLFGNTAKTGMKSFQEALQALAKNTIIAAATLAKYFGAEGFLKNLESTLQGGKRESAEGKGVGSNPQQQDFMSYARQSMLAALLAGPRDQKKQTAEQWREETLKELQALRADATLRQKELTTVLATIIRQAFLAVITESGLGQFITSVNGAVSPQSTVGAIATAGLGPLGIPVRFANALFGR